ncbi:A/G-specific adenine glycosylase [Marinihelvus fidelis]|uniref:Adenine DNA glycosylase n=1 Tax=Marinihelvus fidelis TaxID=2613842 RepID=A0A5N0T9S4_9GAMM|nr:A/G-specific adenine glycosylase [Marinihelvus fidelis]KAA9130877.1 A/G-specific adenine glycosylase [Marinihelvus fidelis]
MAEAAPFAERLLAWWRVHGRHDLPWQHPRTPYRVWVSEIMLQQTQVATVIPYFERFMARFPDLLSLANTTIDDVLGAWQGLGYYARARNLQATAERCMTDHDGRLPDSAEALAALPGIGASTANAIISQAHDRPAVVVDGNVKRLLSRHAAIEGWPGRSAVMRELWAQAETRLPTAHGADYTQAVMDLGATVCSRRNPRCNECPVRHDCQARRQKRVGELPTPRPKRDIGQRRLYMLVHFDRRGRVLLERRPPAGIWGGLWCFPESESRQALAERFRLSEVQLKALPAVSHLLTHLKLEIIPLTADGQRPGDTGTQDLALGVECAEHLDWFAPLQWARLGIPKPVLDILESTRA